MTLEKLSEQYFEQAELILKRIDELKDISQKRTLGSMEQLRLNRRIAILQTMYAETRTTALHMKNYYLDERK